MLKELDCRGLACPQPVLNTKDALEESAVTQVTVIVDNSAAKENVSRFAMTKGCDVEVAEIETDFKLTITKKEAAGQAEGQPAAPAAATSSAPRLVVKITSRFMGDGDEELGRILMGAFIRTLPDATLKPKSLVFYNEGVKLACEGSEHLEAIRRLMDLGVDVVSCGTCLEFYHLKEKLAVGHIGNMFEIIEVLSSADRLVSP